MAETPIFMALYSAYIGLNAKDPAVDVARAGVEAGMQMWLDATSTAAGNSDKLLSAVYGLNPAHMQDAVRSQGIPFFAALLTACGQDLLDLKLAPFVAQSLSNDDVRALVARGFDYDGGEYCPPALDWLMRGADFAESNFRKTHPRKNPVLVFWKDNGMTMPKHGLSPEGVRMVADVIRSNNMPVGVRKAVESKGFFADWRCVLATAATGRSLPYEIHTHISIIFGPDRSVAFKAYFKKADSHHGEMERHDRLSRLPSIETILMLPHDLTSFDAIIPARASST
ncbi:hypothetical protein ACOI1H_20050 [Loktanella sp. DJP18]|uniref:hypothetical protein n=1 Tax=Loktanella sp. DJP18 TaxID=3409788 RepID=UPI003BB7D60B